MPIWRRLERQAVERDASRALFNAGSNMPTSTAMMPMTTNSSTKVNARDPRAAFRMCNPQANETDVCEIRPKWDVKPVLLGVNQKYQIIVPVRRAVTSSDAPAVAKRCDIDVKCRGSFGRWLNSFLRCHSRRVSSGER